MTFLCIDLCVKRGSLCMNTGMSRIKSRNPLRSRDGGICWLPVFTPLTRSVSQTNREIRIGVKRMRKKEPSKISEDGWWTRDNHMHEGKKRRKKGGKVELVFWAKNRVKFVGEKSTAAGVQYGWLWLLSVQSSIFRSYFFQGLLQRIRHFLQRRM